MSGPNGAGAEIRFISINNRRKLYYHTQLISFTLQMFL